jgi:16S rRNA (adenine1518-N6/adenine1519-N6)-dimethyltransferase
MLKPQKRFGQNFLKNDAIPNKFLAAAKLVLNSHTCASVIEVGPGMGAITSRLTELELPITAFDIDPTAVLYMNELDLDNVNIVEADYLEKLKSKVEFEDYLFVSNLPYNVGSRILIELTFQSYIPPLVVGLQKEVASKLVSKDNFTLIGAWLGLFYNFKKISDIKPGNYYPAPKVMSTLIAGFPLLQNNTYDQKIFEILKTLFKYPSKTLNNNLRENYSPETISRLYEELSLKTSERLNWDNYKEILIKLSTVELV